MAALNPEIDFGHVLNELSVNRKDSCEVVRELISNSYDANAEEILYFPLMQYDGFIFFDDGEGLSLVEPRRGITPYVAFFSIGKSTKIAGEKIGDKCQGSKLCFASRRVVVMTRCDGEDRWRYKAVENPRTSLNRDYDLTPLDTDDPSEVLKGLLNQPDNRTEPILKYLDQDFFASKSSGTFIYVEGLDVEGFVKHYDIDPANPSSSYIWNYIRLYTKHGDVCHIDASQGFRPDHIRSVGVAERTALYVWANNKLLPIPFGFPYLEKPSADPESPQNITRLSDGRFFARFARKFTYAGHNYSLVIAVDGNRRALSGYENLGRRGNSRSGLSLSDQRGCFISAQGVKVAQYNEIFRHSVLSREYGVLEGAEGQSHYMMLINGPFKLVTNRNLPSNSALNSLNDDDFVRNILKALDDFKRTSDVFRAKNGTQIVVISRLSI
jgi:hypothetical protein